MSPTEAIPLLIVVLLMISIGGGDVERMSVTFQGDHDVVEGDGVGGDGNGGDGEPFQEVHVVAGGTTTVPANVSVTSDVYAIGGTTRIEGEVDGDVTLLAGNLTVVEDAAVTGTVQTIAGDSSIADGATVGDLSAFEPPTPATSPANRIGSFLMQFLVLAFAGWWLARRHPGLLDNVGHAIVDHALVSGVVGALAAATLLVLFVYMAFTLILIPVSIAGLIGELLIVLYGQVVFGYLVGTRLPIDRADLATVAGIFVFLVALEVLDSIPYLGVLVQFGVVVIGVGAILNTYFGLQRFEPVTLPGGADR